MSKSKMGALQWCVAALAIFAIAAMVAIIVNSRPSEPPTVESPAPTVAVASSPVPTSQPTPTRVRKLTRTQIAQQKKAAAIAAKPTKFELARKDGGENGELSAGHWFLGLGTWAIIIWAFFAWRKSRRKYWARVQGEGFEEGRLAAQRRAGIL